MRCRERGSLVVSLVALAACSGDGGTGVQLHPAVAGQWDIEATIDGLPASVAIIEGTLSITQASRSAPDLGGTWTFVATIGGEVIPGSGVISQGSVTTAGDLHLVLTEPGDPAGSWTLTGTVTGFTASGRHTLSDGTDSFSGDWTGRRQTIGSAGAKGGRGATDEPGGLSRVIQGVARIAPTT